MKTAKTDFPNLNLRYFYAPLQEMIENYVKKGGAATDVIEPSDGFHPSQLGNELLGELCGITLCKTFPRQLVKLTLTTAKYVSDLETKGDFNRKAFTHRDMILLRLTIYILFVTKNKNS